MKRTLEETGRGNYKKEYLYGKKLWADDTVNSSFLGSILNRPQFPIKLHFGSFTEMIPATAPNFTIEPAEQTPCTWNTQ